MGWTLWVLGSPAVPTRAARMAATRGRETPNEAEPLDAAADRALGARRSIQSPPAVFSAASISSPQRSNRLGPMPLHRASSASVRG